MPGVDVLANCCHRLNGLDGAGEALRILVNEASKMERSHFLNVRPHERTDERIDYANGFKPKTVMTRVGELTFEVPQVRGGGFYPSALEKGSRTEQALNIALAEMYVQGVPPPARGIRNTGEQAMLVAPEYACGVYIGFVGPA